MVEDLKEQLGHIISTAQLNGGLKVDRMISDLRASKIRLQGKPRQHRATLSELEHLGKENKRLGIENKEMRVQLDKCQEQNLNYRQQIEHGRYVSG
jgi:hypothetical protein